MSIPDSFCPSSDTAAVFQQQFPLIAPEHSASHRCALLLSNEREHPRATCMLSRIGGWPRFLSFLCALNFIVFCGQRPDIAADADSAFQLSPLPRAASSAISSSAPCIIDTLHLVRFFHWARSVYCKILAKDGTYLGLFVALIKTNFYVFIAPASRRFGFVGYELLSALCASSSFWIWHLCCLLVASSLSQRRL